MATHHFADVAQQRQQQFRKLPGALPHESASLSVGPIFRIRDEINYHPPLRTESLRVGVLPDAPSYGHVVKPE